MTPSDDKLYKLGYSENWTEAEILCIEQNLKKYGFSENKNFNGGLGGGRNWFDLIRYTIGSNFGSRDLLIFVTSSVASGVLYDALKGVIKSLKGKEKRAPFNKLVRSLVGRPSRINIRANDVQIFVNIDKSYKTTEEAINVLPAELEEISQDVYETLDQNGKGWTRRK